MLPKKRRLSLTQTFKQIKKEGKTIQSKYFSLILKKEKPSPSCFAIIISRKVEKKATLRNRVKRQLSSIIMGNAEQLKEGYAVVIIIKKEFLKIKKNERVQIVLNAFSKADLLNIKTIAE